MNINLKTMITLIIILIGIFCTTSFVIAQNGTWTTKAAMPTARTFLGACVLNGNIYAIGGATSTSRSTDAVEMYDPTIDTWITKASMPTALCYPNVCVLNGKIYVFGGSATMWSGLSNVVYVYDPDSDTWTQKADSHHEYLDPVIAVVDSQVYLIGGGKDAYTAPVNGVDAYLPSTDTWTKKTDMPTARYMFTACVFNNKIYCFGGTTENWTSVFYKMVEVYDPNSDTWTSAMDMPVGRWCPAACQVDSLIYVIGGYYGQNACNRVDVLNPRTNVWTQGTPINHIRHGLAACVIDKKIYVIGGSYLNNGTPTFLNSLEVFDTSPSTGIHYAEANDNKLKNFFLCQNYPNPFNPSTKIKYSIPSVGTSLMKFVHLKIYDILGNEVATLVNEEKPAGSYEVEFNAANLPSGIYFYQLKAGNYIGTKKMILMK